MRVVWIATGVALLLAGCSWGYDLSRLGASSDGAPTDATGGFGGEESMGGAPGDGGSTGTGGAPGDGGSTGTGGAPGDGGSTGTGGAPDGCGGPSECPSGICANNICQDPTCSDEVQNQDEAAVDCGGVCGATCSEGQPCNTDGDCLGNSCVDDFCDACPGDDDIDSDGVCDAQDLENRAFLAGIGKPSLSTDGAVLFAISLDRRELHAYDVQVTPTGALTPIDTVTVAVGTRVIKEVFALDEARVAVAVLDTSSSAIQWIQVYALQGSTLTLVEDIDTTTNRIYAVHYDSGTDQLYWSNYLTPPVYSYQLATTPLGFTGLGAAALPFTQIGGYGVHFAGSLLFKVSGSIEVGDLNTNSVVASWPLGAGIGGAIGQNSVAVVKNTLLFTTYFGTDVRFIMEDVSALPAHALISEVQLAPTDRNEAHFVVRGPAPLALVATAGQPLRLFDLSTLPAAPAAPSELPGSVLGGDTALGFLDCNDAACFVAADTGLYVLAP